MSDALTTTTHAALATAASGALATTTHAAFTTAASGALAAATSAAFTTATSNVLASTHDGFTVSDAMFYSPFATVPTGGPLDV
ncbi:hypothetical protein ACFWGL_35155 [Streptomyces sp. NPDC060286]|uniref:hypothetical protein n=1 Tax=unclassified Streptomyces TaxID=2593676 RepID=UPI0035E16CAD